MKRFASTAELEELCEKLKAEEDKTTPTVTLCGGTGCTAFGSPKVREAFETYRKEKGLKDKFRVKMTGCHGFCEKGPVLVILPEGIFYPSIQPEQAPRIVEETVLGGKVIEELLYVDPVTSKRIAREHDLPFYAKQQRLVFRANGRLDPCDLEDYFRFDGYAALGKALTEMTPDEVIEEVKKSGLRGRGGAGFPTGVKWGFCRKAEGDEKYLICNADEGDPGAFMDRSVLEGNPHSVVEGMAIAGYAIGAEHGYIYVRAEYPLAVKNVTKAIKDAEAAGLLGDGILGTRVSFHIKIKMGAGAFVCGEETALMASIEGRRGMPRARPPFPANSGLWGKPTNINNVETLANVPLILQRGAEWYASMGTEGSKGTKIFALAGKVNNTGLVEVPMGATLREIVYEIGGGIPRGRKFKAAQMGGPSGGCVPAPFLDMPIDYDSVKQIGAIMGSGGLIVMDDATCMVDIARFFLEFVQAESCGKCVPCRVGTKAMLDILTRITEGKGEEGDSAALEALANKIKASALCGLGQTAPNPVLSTIRYFRDEYEAHIRDKHCPAASCEALVASPCQHTCPAGINVPHYVNLVSRREYDRAVAMVRRRNPFVSTCGRVCHHPCENRCRRGDLDEPISIMELKRVAADNASDVPVIERREPTGKRVAVVGAGPAGLGAAYFLTLMGHSAVVFEATDRAGGMLAWGIPEYRLPQSALDKDIEHIKSLGVEIRTGVAIGRDMSLDDLRRDFNAVFIGAGAWKPMGLQIPGEELDGILDGMNFLREIRSGETPPLGKHVGVIGGGNVAMDSARSALRLGAERVTVFYRRSREEMPAIEEEIEAAEEEGILFEYLCVPTKFLGNGTLEQAECIRMELGPADESGRRRPMPIDGSEYTVDIDTVIMAIGQATELGFAAQTGIALNKWGWADVDPKSLATSLPGVFAGGDCVTGGATVVEAVAAGQRAAVHIDLYFGGKGLLPINSDYLAMDASLPTEEDVDKAPPRPKPKHVHPKDRIRAFDEVSLGCSKRATHKEAMRCLRCDIEKQLTEREEAAGE